MDDSPTVSVVITAYNEEQYIGAALDSVVRQTWSDWEVVVVDDGSTDDTKAVVQRYSDPVRYVYQENRGQPPARNRGIRAARGEYIAFLDADDLWHPEKLARQMSRLKANPSAKWCYSDAFFFESASGQVLHAVSQRQSLQEGDIFQALLLGNFILSPTPVVHHEVFEAVGHFNEDPALRNGEDWAMWLRIAERYPVECVFEPLAFIRQHQARMSQGVDLSYALNSRLSILESALARHPALDASLCRRARSNVYYAVGRWALNRQHLAEARRLFGQALRLAPTNRSAWVYLIATLVPQPVRELAGSVRRARWARERSEDGARTVEQMMESAGAAGEAQYA
jgi:glycosyltransferase involved in cell wall biosynthesis